jgi:hypothetical protein
MGPCFCFCLVFGEYTLCMRKPGKAALVRSHYEGADNVFVVSGDSAGRSICWAEASHISIQGQIHSRFGASESGRIQDGCV